MARMQYITRSATSPQGKSKVLFVAHRDEIKVYLDEIAEDILKINNCAVWYDPDPRILFIDDYYENLSEMQLLVIAVTEKLLDDFKGNGFTELKYALEHHIPVLPLLQDPTLLERYNHIFGNIQYLCKQEADPTALPFEQKLEQYLNSVLISDELTNQIINEFDGRIFLSYRKKDRYIATQLMRKIHDISFCRDIAIWYDEYLVPGENFDTSIHDAIAKSDLFVLAVTPRLVCEENYVAKEEYPAAIELGKRVVPVEVENTDPDTLPVMFPGISMCVSADDSKAMEQAFTAALADVASRENDDSPAHIYMIGLAYLSGIGVEVDRQRALAMITRSAENGFIPAVEKLIDMYIHGNGVRRDYQVASDWMRKLYTFETADFKGWDDETLYYKIYSAGKLADGLHKISNLQDSIEMYRRCLTLCDQLFPGERRELSLLWAHERIGTVLMELRQYDDAERHFRKMLDIAGTLKKSNALNAIWQYSLACQRLAIFCQDQDDFEEAEAYFTAGMEAAETVVQRGLCEFGAYHEAIFMLSELCNKLGAIREALGDFQAAKTWYLKSLDYSLIAEQIAKTDQSARDLMISYQHMGDISCRLGDLEKGEEFFLKMMEIQFRLAKKYDDPETRRDLSVCYCKLGALYEARKDYNRAFFFYHSDLEISQALAGEVATPDAFDDAAVSCENLIRVCLSSDRVEEAKKYMAMKLEYKERYAYSVQNLMGYHALAKSHLEFSRYCHGEERNDHLDQAADIWDQLAELFPHDPSLSKWAAYARKLMENT